MNDVVIICVSQLASAFHDKQYSHRSVVLAHAVLVLCADLFLANVDNERQTMGNCDNADMCFCRFNFGEAI